MTIASAGNLFPEPERETGRWRIGTSGWSYPPNTGRGTWTGVFYPLAKTDELRFYSRFFSAVEINSTFYRPCSAKTAEGWVRRTPEAFEFTVKVWQRFTHEKDLWLPADIDAFKEGIAPLAESGKLGCILFQFPASFHCTDDGRDRLRALLDAFSEYSAAVELRHRSWQDNLEVLDEAGAVPAFIDEPKFRDSIRQVLRARPVLYLRFHGRSAATWWRHEHRDDRYDYLYSQEEIRPYAVRLKELAAEREIEKAYIFFNNHPGAQAVANAAMLSAALDVPLDAPLPDTMLQKFPELLS